MPRNSRCKSKSRIYHIMLRGINRQDVFRDEDDCIRLLDTIKKYKDSSKFEVFSYCIMSNHMHMLLRENEESISDIIKRISSSYVYWYNKKYERCGHLFQERFRSEAVDSEDYFVTVLRYIHQNPVKAGIVKKISDYRWSSYNEFIVQTNIADVDFVLDMFSKDRKKAVMAFCEFNNQRNNDMCLEENEKQRVSDNVVIAHLSNVEIKDTQSLQGMEKGKREEIIRDLKKIEGVSVRQLSRLTGLSKSTIERI